MPPSQGEETQVREDTELLVSLRADPARWLPAILGRYQAQLLRHAGAILFDNAAAQDVVQESFLKLLANGRRIDDLPSWLHRVTHNLAVDHLRRETRLKRLHVEASRGPEPLAESADRPLHRKEVARRLHDELRGLSANERAVLFLKIKEGRSYKEIGAITGLSASNVGYLVHQAIKKLSARLGPPDARKGKIS